MAMHTLTASCLCGATKHSTQVPIDSLPQPAWMCHCDSCRHQNGTLCYMATQWPEAEVNQDKGTMTAYEFSPKYVLLFCSTCGTHMFFYSKVEAGDVTVATRTLGESEKVVKFDKHIFLEDTKDSGMSIWLPAVGDETMKRFAQNDGEELPPAWRAQSNLQQRVNQTDLLPAYCLCKGVEFTISKSKPSSYADERGWWIAEDGRYRGTIDPCNTCTLAAGVDVIQWAYIPAANIKLSSGEDYKVPFGTLKSYKSSEKVTRYFCGCCGAMVFFTKNTKPTIINVAVGLLDAPSGARAEEWLDWTMDEDIDFTEDPPNQALIKRLRAEWKEWKKQQLEKKGAASTK